MPEFVFPDARAVELDDDLLVLDHGTLLVFLGGHCHSLALAVHEETGWPLVAIDHKRDGTRAHVAVRDGDEIVDIGGRHQIDELDAAVDGGVTVVDIQPDDVHALVTERDWSEPRPDLAAPWVQLVLDPAISSSLAPMTTPTLIACPTVGDVDVRIEWNGEARLDVSVRSAGSDAEWRGWKTILFPSDADGKCRFAFNEARFSSLVKLWMSRHFDLSAARHKALG